MKRLFAALCILAFSLPATAQQRKRTVAIEPFDYSTVLTDVQAIFGTQIDIGRGISSLLVKRVAQSGCFTVVERQKLNTLIQEQDLGASGRIKKGTQARTGEIRGADFVILGDIVTFGRDDNRRAAGGGVIAPGGGGVAGGRKRTDKAVVTLGFRMSDNETSEIVMAGEARGESQRVSKGGFAGLFVAGIGVGGFVDFSAQNFAETIIGEAVIDAVDKLAQQVKCDVGSSRKNIEIEGRVAAVNGPVVILNVGSSAGVQVGDVFDLAEVTGEVRDPVTKEVLDLQTSPLGKMTITSVRERTAQGTFSGPKAPKPGDQAVKQ